MTLKQFIEQIFKKNMFSAMATAQDLIELESIEQRLNVMWGVELDIKIKKAPKRDGRFYGKAMISAIARESLKPIK